MTASAFTPHDLLRRGRAIKRELLNTPDLRPVRIALLGGTTTSEVAGFLEILLLSRGFRPCMYESDFGAYYEVAVLSPEALTEFRPDIVVVHTSTRNLRCLPGIGATEDGFHSAVRNEIARFREIWDALDRTVGCQIIQNNFEIPALSPLGNLDAVNPAGVARFINALNSEMSAEIARRPRLLLNDIAMLSARVGHDAWFDDSRWYAYKIAHSPIANFEMASSLAAIVGALYFGPKKCLVLDLDNTLWGGVIGDDGVDNIKLGRETPEAEAFIAFQEYCLSLRDRGVLLAVCSKNNHDIAMQGLRHQDAVLKPEHFSAIRANWLPKHENINSIAEELNLGVDSFVFVDDNPAERALVAAQLPSVAVPDVGSDVTFFARIVDRARYFESVALSAEDLARASQYRSNSERTAVAATFANYGEYLASLEMVAEIDAFRSTYLDRITQLTNKTNQFNLTTRRYTAVEIEGMASDPECLTLYGRLADRFGDNGLVSVIAGRMVGHTVQIELWLMSCRVLKRDMELAMLDVLVDMAARRGATTLQGHYIPTAKNAMVEDHYPRLGFAPLPDRGDAGTYWTLDVGSYSPQNRHIIINRAPDA